MKSILAVLIVLCGSNVQRLDAIACYSCQFPSWHYSAAMCTEPFHGESEPTCTASACLIRFANNTDHQENYHVLRNCTDYTNIQEGGCRRFERMYGSMFYKDDDTCCFKGNLSHKAQKPVPTTTCLCQSDRCNEHIQLIPNIVTTSSGLLSTTKYHTTKSAGLPSSTEYYTTKTEALPSPTKYDTSTSRKLTSSTEHITSLSEDMTSPTEYDTTTSEEMTSPTEHDTPTPEDITSPTEYDTTLSEDMTSPIEYDTILSEDMTSITEYDTPSSEDMSLSTEYDTPASEDLSTNTKDGMPGTTYPDTPHTCDDPSASSPVKPVSKLAIVIVTVITIILSIS